MGIRTLLEEEIQSEFEILNDLEVGSDEYKVTVDGLTKLMDRQIELEKNDIEREVEARNREIETELKQKQLDDERKDRLVRNIIAACGIAVPAVIQVWGTRSAFKFEEEGSITTNVGKGYINNINKLLFRK